MSGPNTFHSHLPAAFAEGIDAFQTDLVARNRGEATVRAYLTDIAQFVQFLVDSNVVAAAGPTRVAHTDVIEYLGDVSRRGVSGVSRARKLAALREYFRFLKETGVIQRSPADGVRTPRKERHVRTYLLPDEYTRMLSLAGGRPRDYAILQVFLQTGVRVSELCALTLDDVDLVHGSLRVRGKGMTTREIDLEQKGMQALRNWLAVRPPVADMHLFLNRSGGPLGARGVRKLVVKYRRAAGITRRASCHSLRHTFATYKAQHGVSPFQLQRWLGHASLSTTQIYVHLGSQHARKLMGGTSL